ncbi:unnamed protein product [Calicophoron daubneyi]|uniref:Uncharacterized protein n=1 Tax=Calicophoron daubneyi TaxID=300641 RepID=A0AAV2TKJ7_CALDB
MKIALILLLVAAFCAFLVESKPGRVKCSVQCWEAREPCLKMCYRSRKMKVNCKKECQHKVQQCIEHTCGVNEHVDTAEEHAKYD